MTTRPPVVLTCRGHCCGRSSAVDELDLLMLQGRLERAVGDRARVRTFDCLGPCDGVRTVVVRREGRMRWFADLDEAADVDLLARWLRSADEALPARLASLEFDVPTEPPVLVPRRLDTTPSSLAAAVSAALTDRSGRWTLGVPGADATFAPRRGTTRVVIGDDTVEAVDAGAAMRLSIESDVTALMFDRSRDDASLVLALPRRDAMHAPHVVTELGSDIGAIRPEHRAQTLFDLGVGRPGVSVCVRVGLAGDALVRRLVGLTWVEAFDRAADDLARLSITRIVRTPIGRIEVAARSRDHPTSGAATLDVDTLGANRELPEGWVLPDSMRVAAVFRPTDADTFRGQLDGHLRR